MEQKTYLSLIKHISNALGKIHSDYKRDGIIKSLRTYDEEGVLTYGYLRKLIDMEILINIGTSKKTSRYKWNATEDTDFEELAINVIDFKPSKKDSVFHEGESSNPNKMPEDSQINAIISITLKLQKLGMTEDDIKEEVPKLLKSFST